MDSLLINNDVIDTHARPLSISDDFEYVVYKPNRTFLTGVGPEPTLTLIMQTHEGFEWNQNIFINKQMFDQGKRFKSMTRKAFESKLQEASCHYKDSRVIKLNLSADDKDIFP